MVDGLGCFVPRGPVLDYHGTARDITYVSPRRLPNQQWSSWTFRIPSLSPISTRYLPRSLFGSRLVPRLLSAKALIHRNQDNTSPLLLRCFVDKCRRAFLGQATISTEVFFHSFRVYRSDSRHRTRCKYQRNLIRIRLFFFAIQYHIQCTQQC